MQTTVTFDSDTQRASSRLTVSSIAAASQSAAVLCREICAGPFSVCEEGALGLAAEPGLVIKVGTGCLWVPHHEAHCSVGIGAGESFVVRTAGEITACAAPGTQIELQWPEQRRAVSRSLPPSEFH